MRGALLSAYVLYHGASDLSTIIFCLFLVVFVFWARLRKNSKIKALFRPVQPSWDTFSGYTIANLQRWVSRANTRTCVTFPYWHIGCFFATGAPCKIPVYMI
jgi:uncharacterized membrane protein YfcA